MAKPSESSSSVVGWWSCEAGHSWDGAEPGPCPRCGGAPLPDEEGPKTTIVGKRPRFIRPVVEGEALPELPGYELMEELGRGGMGVVYKARQKGLNRLVALKMLLPGGRDPRRFRQEAEAVARLQHPNIVQVYEVGDWEPGPGRPRVAYFSMEYCPGGTLSQALGGTPLLPSDAASAVVKVARAVQHAHDQGIVHRDIKPGNVLLAGGGAASERGASTDGPHRPSRADRTLGPLGDVHPKVADFGLARNLNEEHLTVTGEVMGTPAYMSPEQAEGKKSVGPLSDVYSLGALLYACLTGRAPFQAATALDVLMQVVNDDPVPVRRLNRQVPEDLETICHKCLNKAPSRRYQSAAELADDLERFLDGKPILARPLGALERCYRWALRYPLVSALIALLVLVAVSASVLAAQLEFQRLDLAVYMAELADEVERQREELPARRRRLEQAQLEAARATHRRAGLEGRIDALRKEEGSADRGRLADIQAELRRLREQQQEAEKEEARAIHEWEKVKHDLEHREEQVRILNDILPPPDRRPPRPPYLPPRGHRRGER